MNKFELFVKLFLSLVLLAFYGSSAFAQNSSQEIYFFKKNERNFGINYYSNKNREELSSDKSNYFEELTTGSAKLNFSKRYWNYLDFKQEKFDFNIETGLLWGSGNWNDSSYIHNIEADHTILGVRTNANISYSNRYYWDRKNYTIVDISAWGRYDLYSQKSEGIAVDSNLVSSVYDNSENQKKLRFGFQAKAGWGFGRLNPMNNFMIADYLLQEYYMGRNFSQVEIVKLADEIGRIKQGRSVGSIHNKQKEIEQLQEFISRTMFLTIPDNLVDFWQFGEFSPRLNGKRAEIGPYFNYFNREPDFVYGGYFKYENIKYSNYKWNRNFKVNIAYNGYKRRDWVLAEIDFGWSYFSNLKSQFDFGLKYIPGMVVDGFENIEPLSHNFIPYFTYYTQFNSKTRIKMDLALRIADDEQFILPGPEFSLSVYRSKY